MSSGTDDLTNLTYGWVIQRPDGAGFACTSNDRASVLDGVRHSPAGDLKLEQLIQDDQLLGSRLAIEGSIQVGALSAADMEARRWDNATLSLSLGEAGQIAPANLLCRGELGRVTTAGGRFACSVSIVPAKLDSPPCIQTTPECRALLGDQRCGVDMRKRRSRATLAEQSGATLTLTTPAGDRFRDGQVRWLTGENAGIDQAIVGLVEGSIILREAPPYGGRAGDMLLVSEGCDGRAETCGDRFDNIVNLRAEPNLPHTDALLRYPGA